MIVLLRLLAVAVLLCLPFSAHAQKTKAVLTTEINTNWPDNSGGAITPALLRSTVLDIVNSYYDLAGGTSLSCAAHQWIAALPTLSSITCAQPAAADISGLAPSATTDTTNASNISSGILSAARLSSGVDANVLNAKTANYSIATTDCGSTISGSGGPWTLTLPAVSGFNSACVVQVCNADANDNTHHALILSGFPAPSLGRLWMQQCEEVAINNGAWVVTKWPGRFRPGFVPTLFVDTGGNDNNDGLVSNAAANALRNPQTCWTIFQREMDLGTIQPFCSPTGGQIFTGGLSCSSAGTPNVYFLTGNGGTATIRNTGGTVVVQENDFCGYIIFDAVNLDCTGAASHPCFGLFIHQQNGADLSTSGHTTGVAFTGANSGDIGLYCDSVCKVNTAGLVTCAGILANCIFLDYASVMDLNNGLTMNTSATFSDNVVKAAKGSQFTFAGTLTLPGAGGSSVQYFGGFGTGTNILLGANFAVSGTSGGTPRQWAILNGALLCNASATAVPGSAGLSTGGGTTGYANGTIVVGTTSTAGINGNCIP